MIIKTAILFLRMYDLLCDSYDWSKNAAIRIFGQHNLKAPAAQKANPSYSLTSYNS
ncbi:MAG: hypothetical protein AB7S69_14390 [Salinivirgaceae bacterium]